MPKIHLGKHEKPTINSKLYKKLTKKIAARNNFVIVFASNFRVIKPHDTRDTKGCSVCISSVIQLLCNM